MSGASRHPRGGPRAGRHGWAGLSSIMMTCDPPDRAGLASSQRPVPGHVARQAREGRAEASHGEDGPLLPARLASTHPKVIEVPA